MSATETCRRSQTQATHEDRYIYILNEVRCPRTDVRPSRWGGQLSSERRHNENDVIMRTGAASAVGARRPENDVTMIVAALWRYGDWTCGHKLQRSSN